MDRPASRGLLAGGVQKAPTGLAIDKPERPSSAAARQQHQQQQQQQVGPPGTASSGRGGTAAFRSVLQSQQASQAQARPLTQQGMGGGLKPGTAGAAGRQVLDRAYFVNELRQKRQQIVAVIGRMQEDLEVLDQKKAAAARADKLAGQLKKEVRLLQEALADNNIVIDKAGSQAPLAHIHAEFGDIKARNEAQQERVEDILSQRLGLEQQAKQVDAQIAAIQSAQEQRLNSMAPAARQAYNSLVADQAALLAEAGRCEEEAAELTAALAAAERELSRNGFKQRVLEVQEQIRVLTERKVELMSAEEAAKATPEEQKEALMSRIKRDNAAVEQLTAEAKQMQAQVKQLEARQQGAAAAAASTGATATGGSGGGSVLDDPVKRAKYEELRVKERELTAFMDAFPQRRALKQQQMQAKQDAIMQLLAHINELQQQQGVAGSTTATDSGSPSLPPGAAASAMQQSARVSLSAAAAAAVASGSSGSNTQELAARRAELHKLEELEGKIGVELAALRQQLAGLQGQVDMCADVEGARRAKEATREELEAQQQDLRARHEALQADLASEKWQQQSREAQLKEHAAWPAIDRLDLQLKQVQEQCKQAREFVQAHEASSNYAPLVPQLTALVDSINAANIAAAVAGA